MENIANDIRKSDAYKKAKSNPFVWSLIKFVFKTLVEIGQDLLDDGQLNRSNTGK